MGVMVAMDDEDREVHGICLTYFLPEVGYRCKKVSDVLTGLEYLALNLVNDGVFGDEEQRALAKAKKSWRRAERNIMLLKDAIDRHDKRCDAEDATES